MTNKKLGLLLAPLIPLTAIGIVEVANELVSMREPTPVAIHVAPTRVAPRVAPTPPAPEPGPAPTAPRTVTAE